MANQKLTDRSAFGATLNLADLVHIVDVSDTSQDPAGSSFKLSLSQLKSFVNDNIYNTDGTLTSNRAVSMNTFDLTFTNGQIGIGGTPSYKLHVVPDTNGDGLFVERAGNSLFLNPSSSSTGCDITSTLFMNLSAGGGNFRLNGDADIKLYCITGTNSIYITSDQSASKGLYLYNPNGNGTVINAGFNTSTPTASIHIVGSGATSSTYAIKTENSAASPLLYISDDGSSAFGAGVIASYQLYVAGNGNAKRGLLVNGTDIGLNVTAVDASSIGIEAHAGAGGYAVYGIVTSGRGVYGQASTGFGVAAEVSNVNGLCLYASDALGAKTALFDQTGTLAATNSNINTRITRTIDLNGFDMTGALLHINDNTASTGDLLTVIKVGSTYFSIKEDGTMTAGGLQVGDAGLATGDLYVDTAANILANGDNIVARKV